MTDRKDNSIEMRPEDLQEFSRLLSRFVTAYSTKPTEQTEEDWLRERLLMELPEMGEENAARQSRETIEAVHTYDKNLASLLSAVESGKTEAEWFAEHACQSGLPDSEIADRMVQLYTAVDSSVEQADLLRQKKDWTSSEVRLLGKLTGERMMLAGVQNAVQFAECDSTYFTDKPTVTNDVLVRALETGKDVGLKAAATGALAVVEKKQILPAVTRETPVSVYANLACISIENTKTAIQVGENKMTEREGIDRMAANTTSAVGDLAVDLAVGTGMQIGFTVGTVVLGSVGGVLGGIIGGVVAESAGPKIRETVEKAKKTIANGAKKIVENVGKATNKVKEKVKSFFAKKLFG